MAMQCQRGMKSGRLGHIFGYGMFEHGLFDTISCAVASGKDHRNWLRSAIQFLSRFLSESVVHLAKLLRTDKKVLWNCIAFLF